MAFKLQTPKVQNATQPENKNQAPMETKSDQTGSNAQTPAKRTGGLVIPGKAPAPVSASKDLAPAKIELTPKQEVLTPALAGSREELEGLPAGVPEAAFKDFMESKKYLHTALEENTPMIGFALRRVMVDLKQHPELAEFLLPEDCGAMIRSLRTSYGAALKEKEKKKRKPKNGDKGGASIDLSDLGNMMLDM